MVKPAQVFGIKVKFMLDWDPIKKLGPMTPLHDVVIIYAPKGKYVNSVPAPVVTLAALLLEAPLTAVEYPEMVSGKPHALPKKQPF